MKKLIPFLLAITICFINVVGAYASSPENDNSLDVALTVNAKSAVLMEASTGKVLFSQNEEYFNSPASVTKIMTLLLVCEALGDGRIKVEDTVSISEYAASMGGSQVFLEEGERMSVEELIKCTVIASANDAAVALAEYTEGSEMSFVAKMNEKAKELGLTKTSFENVTGLDDDTVNHYTSAMDIAIMTRELLCYDIITKYSSLWQDTIRNGEFVLTNTNRLVRFLDGCNGLKTGSTDKAGYCISATAKRGDMQLIAVIMNAESITERNNSARALLEYGFSNYALYVHPGEQLENIPTLSGTKDFISTSSEGFSCVVNKSDISKIDVRYNIPEFLTAPINEGEEVGEIVFKLGDKELGKCLIVVTESVEKISLWGVFVRVIKNIFL